MTINSDLLTLTRPDDWHLHLRDGPALRDVVGHTASQFRRAIVMLASSCNSFSCLMFSSNILPPCVRFCSNLVYHGSPTGAGGLWGDGNLALVLTGRDQGTERGQ